MIEVFTTTVFEKINKNKIRKAMTTVILGTVITIIYYYAAHFPPEISRGSRLQMTDRLVFYRYRIVL